jgi:hypothetical protein
MLGTFQQSQLRLEVSAPEHTIRETLLYPKNLRQWLSPGFFAQGLPDQLSLGLTFSRSLGLVKIQHQVDQVNDNYLRLILSEAIDGYHEWYWGDGWLQSRLEGISLLPLNLGHTLSLLRLKEFLAQKSSPSTTTSQ